MARQISRDIMNAWNITQVMDALIALDEITQGELKLVIVCKSSPTMSIGSIRQILCLAEKYLISSVAR